MEGTTSSDILVRQLTKLFEVEMSKLNKWLYKRNEAGFINKEHEKLEKYLMIGAGFLIAVTFFSLVAWVLIET